MRIPFETLFTVLKMATSEIIFGDVNQEEFEKREHRRLQNRLAQRKRRKGIVITVHSQRDNLFQAGRSQHSLHGRKQGHSFVTTTLPHDPRINSPNTGSGETRKSSEAFGSEKAGNDFGDILVQHQYIIHNNYLMDFSTFCKISKSFQIGR